MNLRITAAVLSFLVVFPAAAAQRTFVSSTGVNTNPCTLAAPCRDFSAALAQTNANGEVVALDSAGYGTITISQAVTLVAPTGVHAAMSVFSGAGVTVNAPGAAVTLRNLYINGQGGAIGIQLTDAGSLHIEHCVVGNFSNTGIALQPSANADVYIGDSIVRDAASSGIYADTAATLRVSIVGTEVENTAYGIAADHGSVFVRNSNVKVSGTGFLARGNTGPVVMALENTSAAYCTYSIVLNNIAVFTMHDGLLASSFAGVTLNPGTGTAVCLLEHVTMINCTTGIDQVSGGVTLTVLGCSILNGGTGVKLESGTPTVSIAHSSISNNNTALQCAVVGTFRTTGDNVLVDDGVVNNGCTIGAASTF